MLPPKAGIGYALAAAKKPGSLAPPSRLDTRHTPPRLSFTARASVLLPLARGWQNLDRPFDGDEPLLVLHLSGADLRRASVSGRSRSRLAVPGRVPVAVGNRRCDRGVEDLDKV